MIRRRARAPAVDSPRRGPTGCRERTPIRYRTGVSIVQTVLVFVGIPAGIIAVIFVAVYGKSMVRQPNRYRPGKAWDFEPSWYVPHPEAVVGSTASTSDTRSTTTAVGGASGEW